MYLCNPLTGEVEKIIDKTEGSTSKYRLINESRALISLRNRDVRSELRDIKKLYKEEFDPGSG